MVFRRLTVVVAAALIAGVAVGQPIHPAAGFLDLMPEAAALLAFTSAFAGPLKFLFVFGFVGFVLSYCARRAFQRGEAHVEGYVPDPVVARRVAIGYAIAWFVAAAAGLHVVGFAWLPDLVLSLLAFVGRALMAAAIAAAAAALGLALGARKSDLALSLIGSYYIANHPHGPRKAEAIDLGDGRVGKILRVDFLHTTFDLGGGQLDIRPNAWLMRKHFGWGAALPEPPQPEPPSNPPA